MTTFTFLLPIPSQLGIRRECRMENYLFKPLKIDLIISVFIISKTSSHANLLDSSFLLFFIPWTTQFPICILILFLALTFSCLCTLTDCWLICIAIILAVCLALQLALTKWFLHEKKLENENWLLHAIAIKIISNSFFFVDLNRSF